MRDSTCILAGGPSLTEQQIESVRLWRGRVIAINTTFEKAPWADVIYACDGPWWKIYIDRVLEVCSGELWTQSEGAQFKHPRLNVVRSLPSPGLSRKIGVIHQHRNGGFQAVELAYQWGAKKIILLGFDMREVGGKKHHHPDHPSPLNSSLPFASWIEASKPLARDLADEGVQVINCTPGSALDVFSKITLEDALSDCDFSHTRPAALQTASV